MVKNTKTNRLATHVAVLRIIFGIMWAVDASFKWSASFASGMLAQVTAAESGQPGWLHPWFDFWVHLLSSNIQFFAFMVAVIETLIAIALIFGVLRQVVYIAAAVFSLFIWAIPEGFGGPYSATSTDIGVGIIYAVVFFSLYGLERMAWPSKWSLDQFIARRIPWWSRIADPRPAK